MLGALGGNLFLVAIPLTPCAHARGVSRVLYAVHMDVKDVTGAAGRLLTISVDGYAPGRNHPGRCTRWVYYALGATPNRSPLPDAVTAWNNIPAVLRLPAGANLVADMPYFLGATGGPRWKGDLNWMYGDVVIATGRGREVACTDKPGTSGIVGLTTLDARSIQTGRPILGGGRSYGGWELTSSGLSPITPTEPPTEAQMSNMRLIRNNTPGDKNFGSVDLMCVETGFWWHTQGDGYIDAAKEAYGIKVEDMAANWWGFWKQLVSSQRQSAAAAVWSHTFSDGSQAGSLQRDSLTAQDVWNYEFRDNVTAGVRLRSIDQKDPASAEFPEDFADKLLLALAKKITEGKSE